ncbi:hypothetical protein SLNSH_09370 [Alsobacter soli]|uniref:SPW repeat-containing integral membrane domain-containing protein n=1 Tax=Alsobacter soli TaxID=2109933 RepID=A0A2T1HUU9_9HYPH|nr:SPW repeat protein [Alsobacter soli]PSC05443.1 hypothetical protein SLNSH_09370 [Alsobacter soli]
MSESMLRKTPVFDAINLIAAVALFVAPWVVSFGPESYANWNAWISAAVIALVALGAITAFSRWEEVVNLVAGLWLIAAPWALRFTGDRNAVVSHLVIGAIVAVCAAVRLWAATTSVEATAR